MIGSYAPWLQKRQKKKLITPEDYAAHADNCRADAQAFFMGVFQDKNKCVVAGNADVEKLFRSHKVGSLFLLLDFFDPLDRIHRNELTCRRYFSLAHKILPKFADYVCSPEGRHLRADFVQVVVSVINYCFASNDKAQLPQIANLLLAAPLRKRLDRKQAAAETDARDFAEYIDNCTLPVITGMKEGMRTADQEITHGFAVMIRDQHHRLARGALPAEQGEIQKVISASEEVISLAALRIGLARQSAARETSRRLVLSRVHVRTA